MTDNFSGPILTEEFIQDLLLHLSNAVYEFRRGQPDFADFQERRRRWNETLEGLDQTLQEQYDNEVTPAFADYQEVLENYLITQGILQTIGRRLSGETEGDSGAGPEVPGLAGAAGRLEAACRAFAGRLSGEDAGQCAAYLKLRREVIDGGRDLCRRCGAELAEGLLARTGA